MTGASAIGLMAAFAAGAISFLALVLPLVPGYVSYIAGRTVGADAAGPPRLAALGLGLCFRAGLFHDLHSLRCRRDGTWPVAALYRYQLNFLGAHLSLASAY